MKNSFLISLLVFIIYMLASCKTEYIPHESARFDSVFFAKIQKDSIFVKDSVFIKEKGDTVFKDRFKVIYKYVLHRDTVLSIRKDSILVPYPIEKKRTFWEQTKIDIATIAIVLVIFQILHFLMKWIIKRTRKE